MTSERGSALQPLRFCIREEGYERKGGRIRAEGSELRDPSGINQGRYPSGGIRVEGSEWRDPSGGIRVDESEWMNPSEDEWSERRNPSVSIRTKGSE